MPAPSLEGRRQRPRIREIERALQADPNLTPDALHDTLSHVLAVVRLVRRRAKWVKGRAGGWLARLTKAQICRSCRLSRRELDKVFDVLWGLTMLDRVRQRNHYVLRLNPPESWGDRPAGQGELPIIEPARRAWNRRPASKATATRCLPPIQRTSRAYRERRKRRRRMHRLLPSAPAAQNAAGEHSAPPLDAS